MKKYFKWLLIIVISVVISSCYDNEIIIIDESEENNLRVDDDLTTLMKSVTSHNASFDDLIDNCHCFSVNFPYQVIVEQQVIDINTEEDLNIFVNVDDEIEFVYPISISLTNFEVHNISSSIELNQLKEMCYDGLFYEDHIDCANFIYPLRLAVYDPKSRRFDKIELNSNKETFLFLDGLDNDAVFEIEYPTNIFMFHQHYFRIESNFSLTTHFKIAHNTCGIRD